MPTPPILFRVFHAAGSRLRVLVNEVSIYDRDPIANQGAAGAVSQFLVPGVNTTSVEVTPSEQKPHLFQSTGFRIEMNEYPDDENKVQLFTWEWANLRAADGTPGILPHVDLRTFEVDVPVDRPAFLDAPPEEFPSEGTDELHRAVEELHGAFAAKDGAAFARALDLQVTELERPYGSMPHLRGTPDPEMAPLQQPWELRPYDRSEIVFERRAGGRIAQPMRKGGGPVLFARDRSDPKQTWSASPQLTRQGGRWRIFHV